MHIFLTMVYFFISLFTGCSEGSSPSNLNSRQTIQLDRDDRFINSYINQVIKPSFAELELNLSLMQTGLEAICTHRDNYSIKELQKHWHYSMYRFHYLSSLVTGPVTFLDLNSPLRFIYFRPPNIAPRLIEREIQRAYEKKESYQQLRPLAHSLGFQALEYILFEKMDSTNPSWDSGTCYYTQYVIRDLQSRVGTFKLNWRENVLAYINSPEGQTQLDDVVSDIAGYIVLYLSQIVRDEALLKPLALLNPSPCQSLQECIEDHLDHPFAQDRKIRISAGLQALNDIFNGKKIYDGKTFSLKDYLSNSSLDQNQFQLLREMSKKWDELSFAKSLKASSANEIHVDLKNFIDAFEQSLLWLSTDFIVEINAKLPQPVQGDGD